MTSDTPRTDAEADSPLFDYVHIDFARELEREEEGQPMILSIILCGPIDIPPVVITWIGAG